jgi:hypothetical protein
MGTWNSPEPEVKELCIAVDDNNVSLTKLRKMYNKSQNEQIDGQYADTVKSLAEKQTYESTISAVTRHIVHKRCEGEFTWNENNADYDADVLVDENVSENMIRKEYENTDDIGILINNLMSELPDDISDETRSAVKKTLSGKCGRVLEL